MHKTKEQRNKEASTRALSYTYSNSKAKRVGSANEKQWNKRNNKGGKDND